MKSLISPFVDIASIFFDSSFNLFLSSTCFVLFEVTFLFKVFNFSSKTAIFPKARISFLLSKFLCANLKVTFSDVNLLKSCAVIYILWS